MQHYKIIVFYNNSHLKASGGYISLFKDTCSQILDMYEYVRIQDRSFKISKVIKRKWATKTNVFISRTKYSKARSQEKKFLSVSMILF